MRRARHEPAAGLLSLVELQQLLMLRQVTIEVNTLIYLAGLRGENAKPAALDAGTRSLVETIFGRLQ